MSSPAKKFKPFRYCLFILILSLAGGAAIGLVGKQLWSSPAMPATSSTMPTPLSAQATVTPSAQAVSASLASPAQEEVRQVMPTLPVAGNLATITSQRATLAEKKLQKEIDDLDAKSAPASSTVVFSPDDMAKMLEVPVIKQETAEKVPARSSGTTAVAVQGVDGKLTATLRHNGKLVTLAAGEKFAGGTVAAISRQGVTVRTQNGVQSLAFE